MCSVRLISVVRQFQIFSRLFQECLHFNETLFTVRTTLNLLQEVISGAELTISSDHYNEALSLSRDYTPAHWIRKYVKDGETISLLSWLNSMRTRMEYLHNSSHEENLLHIISKTNLTIYNNVIALVSILKYLKFLETGTSLDQVKCSARNTGIFREMSINTLS